MLSPTEYAQMFSGLLVLPMLLYIPLLCYLDWNYREIPHYVWNLLIFYGAMSLLLGVLSGFYQWWMFIPSFVSIIVYFIAMKMHYIEGADWIFISLISLFFIYNPVTGHWFPLLAFSIFLAAMIVVTGFLVLEYNFITKGKLSFELDGGVPLMFPISAALILTVVLF